MLAVGNQILHGLPDFWSNNDLSLPLGILTIGYSTVNLTENSELFRFTRFEELSDARQTTGNIFGFGRFTRDLSQDVPRRDLGIFGHVDIGAHRKHIARYHAIRKFHRLP